MVGTSGALSRAVLYQRKRTISRKLRFSASSLCDAVVARIAVSQTEDRLWCVIGRGIRQTDNRFRSDGLRRWTLALMSATIGDAFSSHLPMLCSSHAVPGATH